LLLSLVLAITATYSSGNGLLAWPLAAALLAWRESRPNRWMFFAWIVAAVAVVIAYSVGYLNPGHGGLNPTTTDPKAITIFFIAFLGNPFGYATPYSTAINCLTLGSLLLLLFIGASIYFLHAWRNGRSELCGRMLPWLAIGGFCVGSALIAARYRGAWGIDYANRSRYVSFSLYLPLVLVNLIPMIFADLKESLPRLRQAGIPAAAAAIMTLILLQIGGLPTALAGGEKTRSRFMRGRGAQLLINLVPDNPQIEIFGQPAPPQLMELVNAVGKIGYLNPSPIASPNANQIKCANDGDADDISGAMERFAQVAPNEFRILGWSIFPNRHCVTDCVFLTYDDDRGQPIIFAAAEMQVKWGDSATKLNDPNYEWCGWAANFPAQRIPANLHATRLQAWVLNVDTGKATLLDGNVIFRH
jgi:hypothetical protein